MGIRGLSPACSCLIDAVTGVGLLMTKFVQDDSPFRLTRAITRTMMIGPCNTRLSLAPRDALHGLRCGGQGLEIGGFSVGCRNSVLWLRMCGSSVGFEIWNVGCREKGLVFGVWCLVFVLFLCLMFCVWSLASSVSDAGTRR